MSPGEILEIKERRWVVNGVFYGASGQESVIELVAAGWDTPDAYGEPVKIFVPELFVRSMIESGIMTPHFKCKHMTYKGCKKCGGLCNNYNTARHYEIL